MDEARNRAAPWREAQAKRGPSPRQASECPCEREALTAVLDARAGPVGVEEMIDHLQSRSAR